MVKLVVQNGTVQVWGGLGGVLKDVVGVIDGEV